MTVGELHELDEVKMLVARGQEAGLLTFSQIATALAEVELEEGDIEEVHLVLERAEIELVEDDHPFAQGAKPLAPEPKTSRSRKKASPTLDLRPDMTTDSLQLFLKDIGKVRRGCHELLAPMHREGTNLARAVGFLLTLADASLTHCRLNSESTTPSGTDGDYRGDGIFKSRNALVR